MGRIILGRQEQPVTRTESSATLRPCRRKGTNRTLAATARVLVLALSGTHGFLASAVRAFAEDRNTRPQRFYRIINEVPTLFMIGIVILVVVKPF